jgi:hypothetical protein
MEFQRRFRQLAERNLHLERPFDVVVVPSACWLENRRIEQTLAITRQRADVVDELSPRLNANASATEATRRL